MRNILRKIPTTFTFTYIIRRINTSIKQTAPSYIVSVWYFRDEILPVMTEAEYRASAPQLDYNIHGLCKFRPGGVFVVPPLFTSTHISLADVTQLQRICDPWPFYVFFVDHPIVA